ncbi:hypothetical protein F4703DRAFT_1936563 [Phycomyces blakesleeanus]
MVLRSCIAVAKPYLDEAHKKACLQWVDSNMFGANLMRSMTMTVWYQQCKGWVVQYQFGDVFGQETLRDNYLPFLAALPDKDTTTYLLQEDNVKPHKSNPDLNPIENMWGYLDNKVRDRRPQPTTLKELEVALLEKWGEITAKRDEAEEGTWFLERYQRVGVVTGIRAPFPPSLKKGAHKKAWQDIIKSVNDVTSGETELSYNTCRCKMLKLVDIYKNAFEERTVAGISDANRNRPEVEKAVQKILDKVVF